MLKKVAILANGGDVSGFNAVIRAIIKTAENKDVECYGFIDGYRGLLKNDIVRLGTSSTGNAVGILPKGGSIIGSSTNANVFNYPVEENGQTVYKDLSDICVENIKKDEIDCLFTLGGDGTQKSARDLSLKGINVIGVPKTIDNDVACTEIPFDINSAARKIINRKNRGKSFSIVVVAEGAKPKDGDIHIKNMRNNGAGVDNTKLGGIGEIVAKQLEELTGLEARCTVLGYMQRGGTPTAFDRVLSTKYGSRAMEYALEGKFNILTVIKDGKLNCVPLEDVVGNNTKIGAVSGNTPESNLRKVTMDDELVKTARAIGINLGD